MDLIDDRFEVENRSLSIELKKVLVNLYSDLQRAVAFKIKVSGLLM